MHEITRSLTPDLAASLADLHGAPRPLAQAMVQLLPFGSRAALEVLGLAVWRDAADDEAGERRLELTAAAFDVMAELTAAGADRDEIVALARDARAVAHDGCR